MRDIQKSKRRAAARGFTLVELLVVIGIIALLISILLPALGKARKSANTIVCASGMRQATLGMLLYADAYKGAILGSPWTSGASLRFPAAGVTVSDANCPVLCQTWDWEAPLAKTLGIKFEEGASKQLRQQRFDFLCTLKPFQCPENDIVVAAWSGSPISITTKMVSWCTALEFEYEYVNGVQDNSIYGFIDTGDYVPKLSRVGATSEKVWLCDAARWTNSDGPAPNYNLTWDGGGANSSPGGVYSDYGPWCSSSYARSFIPGHPMAYSMRHGDRTVNPNASPSKYRMNVAFFDGHVETMDGLAAMNPQMWMPKGTSLPSSQCNPTCVARFFGGASTLAIH